MSLIGLIARTRQDVPCTVEINNTFEQLGAHLRFEGGVTVEPGDEVMVHGAPISIPYGECATFERTATITRASAIERAWTRRPRRHGASCATPSATRPAPSARAMSFPAASAGPLS